MSSSSLAVTVSRAVAFLTRPLSATYSPAVVNKLQLVLEANLVAAYAPTWDHMQPLRGSGRRCLTLSPHAVPPRPIHSACVAVGINWIDWISLISRQEFDFFVDPGCVSYRVGQKGESGSQFVTVWADEVPSPVAPLMDASRIRSQLSNGLGQKTLSQQLSEFDQEDDEEIFAMINEARGPQNWLAPIDTRFPSSKRSTSPLSTISSHSRSSSSSSISGHSGDSRWTSSSSSSPPHLSRRDRARQARVYVDTNKKEVTPYDGGKTTVLTGGVMLGGASAAAPASVHHGRTSSMNWRNAGF